MTKYCTTICLLIIAVFFPLAAQPQLKFERNGQQDWGIVRPTQGPLKCEFKIYNTGNELLKIIKLEPDCKCTTTPLDKETIKPGEYATVKIEIKLTEKEGLLMKRVKVFTNIEGPDSMQIINMQATVIPSISFFPKKIFNFGMMEIGKISISNIVMTNETDKDIKIFNITPSQNTKINIKNNQVIKAKEDFTIIANLTPNKSGNISDIITFETTDPDMPSVKIYVMGNVINPADKPAPEK